MGTSLIIDFLMIDESRYKETTRFRIINKQFEDRGAKEKLIRHIGGEIGLSISHPGGKGSSKRRYSKWGLPWISQLSGGTG